MKKNLRQRYSGKLSLEFWRRITAIKDIDKHNTLYSLGVVLQDLETVILRNLNK